MDIFKKSIVHFKQLRSLELSNIIFVGNYVSWEVLGTLPSLENLTLKAVDSSSHAVHASENFNSQTGGHKYFEALESLSILGSLFFIQHLLGFIDSPCLKPINVVPVIDRNEYFHEHLFTPSMAIVASKWSQSLKNLVIESRPADTNTISKCLMLLTDLHEIQRFDLHWWRMENMDDVVRRLVMSWPKLRHLILLPLNQSFISLSTLRIIAESCPELFYLRILLDVSTFPPFRYLYQKPLPQFGDSEPGVPLPIKPNAEMSNPSGTTFGFNLPLRLCRSALPGCNLVRDTRPALALPGCQTS